jgi:fatty acid desaturase
VLPARILLVWYLCSATASFLNTLRTLAAHRYEAFGTERDRAGQLADSIDVPGACWTALWAPVGLRYHALHHYFPGLPYHNLGAAYRRLMANLTPTAAYRKATCRGMIVSLAALYHRGKQASAGRLS